LVVPTAHAVAADAGLAEPALLRALIEAKAAGFGADDDVLEALVDGLIDVLVATVVITKVVRGWQVGRLVAHRTGPGGSIAGPGRWPHVADGTRDRINRRRARGVGSELEAAGPGIAGACSGLAIKTPLRP
jgi:hypothetical protein